MNRWVPLAAVVALLGAAMLAALYANPTIDTASLGPAATFGPPATFEPEEQPTQAVTVPPEAAPQVPSWVTPVITTILIVGVAAVLILLLWMLLRGRLHARFRSTGVGVRQVPAHVTQRKVQQAVAEGLAELDDSDGDPRRVVIACWARLERAAAEAGTPRKVGDTSTELVARLLASHQVSDEVLDAFARVYREARFATHTVDAAMRDQARAALQQLRDELSAGVS